MKKIKSCVVENCIPTPSSCVEWNGGDIEFLGVCNGDSINNITVEIVSKLQSIIGGESLTEFDIDSLITICNQNAPLEINLISILTLLKENQICLKDYIDTLNDKIIELSKIENININLKCFANLDNLGNQLSITRETLDQLVIDELCDAKNRINTIEGKIIDIQAEVNNIDPHATVDELKISTCVDAASKGTSLQLIAVATQFCNLQTATGNPAHISSALANTPSDWNTKFGFIPGWDISPDNFAQAYGNALIVIRNLSERLENIENNCCAINCTDVKIGYSAIFNEDETGLILKFTSGAGTSIPIDFTDRGSSGTITDIDGNVETFTLIITQGLVFDVSITGLNLNGDLTINIDAQMGAGTVVCGKCVTKKVKPSGCSYCEYTANGTTGSITILYTSTT